MSKTSRLEEAIALEPATARKGPTCPIRRCFLSLETLPERQRFEGLLAEVAAEERTRASLIRIMGRLGTRTEARAINAHNQAICNCKRDPDGRVLWTA